MMDYALPGRNVNVTVTEAIRSRKSIRAFQSTPVPEDTIREILELAARAPSGGNLQPWRVYVVSGEARDRLVQAVFEMARVQPQGDGPEYDEFPPGLSEPYLSRKRKVGYDLYGLLGIAREDKAARIQQAMKNFTFFEAPVGIFVTIDRQMGIAQYVDLGFFMDNIMLLARERGLDTCGQEAWAYWHKTVTDFLEAPDNEMLFCGIALGYADHDDVVNTLETERAPVDEFTTFIRE
jgi:nitroreductase